MSSVDLLALPFDQYQRYTAIAQIAELVRADLNRPALRVLDVGGFYRTRGGQKILPLRHFLPHDWTLAADLVPDPLPHYILASGFALPFGGRAFDLVVSCDTLEHIHPASRSKFVDELLRVAGHCMVLIAPFENGYTRQAEHILDQYMASQGIRHQQLLEHLAHDLPDPGAFERELAERGLESVDFADGYLPHWLTMMLIKHTPGQSLNFHLDLDRYYNRYYTPGDRKEPAYRRVFVVVKPGGEALLSAVASHLRDTDPSAVTPDMSFAPNLIDLLYQIQAAAASAGSRIAALESENARLRRLVADYDRGRFMQAMRWLHKQRQRQTRGKP
jgi:SAM-dependent methyltransferase